MTNNCRSSLPRPRRIGLSFLIALLMLFCAVQTAPAVMESDLPVELFVVTPPTPVRANGSTVLAYELHVTNFRAMDLALDHVLIYDVADTSKPLVKYPDDGPIAKVWHPGVLSDSTDPRIIHGGQRVVIFFWLQFPPDRAMPRTLVHRLVFSLIDAKGGRLVRVVEGGMASVVSRDLAPYNWPVHSGNWLAANGPGVNSDHRRAMHALNGRTFVAQRFAVDLMKIGDDGRLWHTDPSRNENWYGYGQEVLAAGDGEVTSIFDSIPENTPLAQARAVRMTRANICGNYVVLKLHDGEYLLYGHLKPGGITVKPGQRVKKGDVLGHIGNTGNSDAPHLHFHVIDAPSPLASEGIPYVFNEFKVLSTVKASDLDAILSSGNFPNGSLKDSEDTRRREMPAGNVVIRVP